MDAEIIPWLSRKEQILINRCRLFLQVECVSNISNAEGTKICQEWLHGNLPKDTHSKKTGHYKGTLVKKHGAFGNNLLRDNSQRMN
jgi:hypothetical protein